MDYVKVGEVAAKLAALEVTKKELEQELSLLLGGNLTPVIPPPIAGIKWYADKPKVRKVYMTKGRKQSARMRKYWDSLTPYKRRKHALKLQESLKKARIARHAKKVDSFTVPALDNQEKVV